MFSVLETLGTTSSGKSAELGKTVGAKEARNGTRSKKMGFVPY